MHLNSSMSSDHRLEGVSQVNAEELSDIESIKRLKARYFRFVDGQEWTSLRTLFTGDASFDMANIRITGADDWISWCRSKIEGAKTVHHGSMPEIDLLSATEATGMWAMFDYIDLPGPATPRRMGYGYYDDIYHKSSDAGWLISSTKLVRIRVDQLPAKS
jgi:hypothetical protein